MNYPEQYIPELNDPAYMLYAAYGSNLNETHMAWRCPTAIKIGPSSLENYHLIFRSVADVEPEKGASAPIGLWLITAADEKSLDRYEGYPTLYKKRFARVRLPNGQFARAMFYTMGKGAILSPSMYYYQTIRNGYDHFGLDPMPLKRAAGFAIKREREIRQEKYEQAAKVQKPRYIKRGIWEDESPAVNTPHLTIIKGKKR